MGSEMCIRDSPICMTDILNHISQNLHNPIPGSRGNTFDQSISVGVEIETINNVAGSPSTTYSSVEHYLQIMSHPYAYTTNITRMLQISNSSLLLNYTELSFALPLTAQTILSHRLIIVPYATFYTIQIPSTAPPSDTINICLLYTSPSPRDLSTSRMPSSA